MRLIDADELNMVKFHPLPYIHIVPADLLKCQTEAYERGWNDAIDAIIENAETIEERKTGRWLKKPLFTNADAETVVEYKKVFVCSICTGAAWWVSNYCPNCGARLENT